MLFAYFFLKYVVTLWLNVCKCIFAMAVFWCYLGNIINQVSTHVLNVSISHRSHTQTKNISPTNRNNHGKSRCWHIFSWYRFANIAQNTMHKTKSAEMCGDLSSAMISACHGICTLVLRGSYLSRIRVFCEIGQGDCIASLRCDGGRIAFRRFYIVAAIGLYCKCHIIMCHLMHAGDVDY